MKLNGNFNLYENDLTSGRLSLTLSKELLETSPKFKSLLRVLGEEVNRVSFDFQISGLFEAMNFKWLESDFKRKLQNSLSASIKREIEKKIEEIIKSISAKQEILEKPN